MSEAPYYYVIKKMDTSDEIMSNVHISTVLCRILCRSRIMFISSKVERENISINHSLFAITTSQPNINTPNSELVSSLSQS